jgi:hypothetical protein
MINELRLLTQIPDGMGTANNFKGKGPLCLALKFEYDAGHWRLRPVTLYSGGRDWGLQFKASLGKLFTRPCLEKPFTKRAGRVDQGDGPEFKPDYHKKNK